ncbi:hypothetical protein P278_25460 [Zhouia amylolytica AD3]|uniref:histidine kinase n=2 Tax=Zhouia amylolytica TaxID=376730 RepID=W2UKS6_9FLAO|nr:hypothetical protein P278_25460 [Zhouia amylolytica AD3]
MKMDFSKGKITLKVLISYIVLGILSIVVGHFVFAEIESYTQLQKDNISDQNKILHVGKVLSLMYENEGLARAAIQSKSWVPFDEYKSMNDSLLIEIDTLKGLLSTEEQYHLLDSISLLIEKKESNIQSLKTLKLQDTTETIILRTIDKLRTMESSLGRLTLKDFVSEPESLDSRTRSALINYITYLNENTPRDSNNEINEKTLDSIFRASTQALQELQTSSSKQQASIIRKENELIANDLLISQQIRKILSTIENEVLLYASEISQQRKVALNRSKKIITFAAVIGIALIIIFSVLILNDFWKSQRYRKQLEKTTRKAQLLANTREQLVNMVSHDLRSPLSTIVGYGELLQKSLGNKEKGLHYINKIKNASTYMNHLVEDLLDYSKLETGKITLDLVSFNLKSTIVESSQNIQQQYPKKDISLILDIDQSLKRNIISDPYRIKQILNNLIGNAYKFTDEGSITIKAYTSKDLADGDSRLTIEVQDTGVGIKKEKQHLIFSEFTQVDDDINKKKDGYGLGLTISKKLAHLLNGDLVFTSETGKGSCFKLSVPVKFTKKQQVTEPKKEFDQTTPFPNIKLKAVVIDDDETLRKLITETLVSNQCEVYTCKDGDEAINIINHQEFDLIITDIQLPKMNGFRFVEILKNDVKAYKGQPIIAITGRKDIDQSFYTSNGFSEVIFKPFTPEKLLQQITTLFSRDLKDNHTYIYKDEPNYNTKIVNLKSLRSFVNDDLALKEVLKIFLKDTKKNLEELNTDYLNRNIQGLKATSHKMLTMFKQLDANGVVHELELIENMDSFNSNTIQETLKSLKDHIHKVTKELNKFINGYHTP